MLIPSLRANLIFNLYRIVGGNCIKTQNMINIDEFGNNIYHFTSAEKALLYILPSLKLKISPFSNTNDPKENKTFNSGQIFQKFKNDLLHIEAKKGFQNYIMNWCKVLCFSNDYLIDNIITLGYNHPRMWSQYSNNHQGVCLVINKILFLEENAGHIFDNVSYSGIFNFPTIDPFEYEAETNKSDYFARFLHNHYKDFFYTKHIDWSAEHESRLLCLDQRDYCKIENSLQGIYLGVDFDKNMLRALKIATPKNIWKQHIGIDEGRLLQLWQEK